MLASLNGHLDSVRALVARGRGDQPARLDAADLRGDGRPRRHRHVPARARRRHRRASPNGTTALMMAVHEHHPETRAPADRARRRRQSPQSGRRHGPGVGDARQRDGSREGVAPRRGEELTGSQCRCRCARGLCNRDSGDPAASGSAGVPLSAGCPAASRDWLRRRRCGQPGYAARASGRRRAGV